MSSPDREIGLDQLGAMAEEGLKNGQQVRMTVVGNSMYPLFRNRMDSVILSPITKRIQTRDVVLYKRNNGQYVLHRMIKRKGNVYSANGDNQYWVESPLYPGQMIGVMTGFIRGEKEFSVCAPWYRLYSVLWTVGKKHRKLMLRIIRKLIKLRAWVRKR